jgi:voltage-gated sodium channel
MFARMNLVQNSMVHNRQVVAAVTDEELMEQMLQEQDELKSRTFDYTDHSGIARYYLYVCTFARELTHGKFEQMFNFVMVCAIFFSSVLVGLQTYYENNPVLNILEICVLILYGSECGLKILSEGLRPINYFLGKEGTWNSFDFIVVLLCMPFFSQLVANKSGAIRLVSRLLRLVRIAKLLHAIPALNVIVRGLLSGMQSITFIGMLMVLVFYIYAIIGVYMFKLSDPFFFRTIPVALLTLFHACTLEGWSDNMYLGAKGCAVNNANIYVMETDVSPEIWAHLPNMYKCVNSTKFTVFSYMYWISFTILSSLVMLSLFVGVITMSMQESLDEMRHEVEMQNRKKKLLKQKAEMDNLNERVRQLEVINNMRATIAMNSKIRKLVEQEKLAVKKNLYDKAREAIYNWNKDRVSVAERKKMLDLQAMKTLLLQVWTQSGTFDDEYLSTEGRLYYAIHKVAEMARSIIEMPYFNNFITAVIILTAIVVGLETDHSNPPEKEKETFQILEWFIFTIFALEVILRIAAEEFHFREYFRNRWNIFDFFIVVGGVPSIGGTIVVFLRLLRLFRVLKLVKSLPQLAVIVNALIMGVTSIGYIGIIILAAFYLFAILGYLLYANNDPVDFGTLHDALITLFRMATLDNWGPVMYTNIYGCAIYPPPITAVHNADICHDHSPSGLVAVFYFVTFIVIGALVMLTLFIGVVTTSMEEATRQQQVELELNRRINEVCEVESISHDHLDLYKRVFNMLDFDGGGTIEPAELKMGLNCVNIYPTDEELDKWIKEVDANSDGAVDLVEFILFMTNVKKRGEDAKSERNAMSHARKLLNKFRAKKAIKEETSFSTSSDTIRGIMKQVSMKFGFKAGDDSDDENEQSGNAVKKRHSKDRSDSDSDSTKSELETNDAVKHIDNNDSQNRGSTNEVVLKTEMPQSPSRDVVKESKSPRDVVEESKSPRDVVEESKSPRDVVEESKSSPTQSDPEVTFTDSSVQNTPISSEIPIERPYSQSSVKIEPVSNKVYPEKVLEFSKSTPLKVFSLDQQIAAEQKRKKRSLF